MDMYTYIKKKKIVLTDIYIDNFQIKNIIN